MGCGHLGHTRDDLQSEPMSLADLVSPVSADVRAVAEAFAGKAEQSAGAWSGSQLSLGAQIGASLAISLLGVDRALKFARFWNELGSNEDGSISRGPGDKSSETDRSAERTEPDSSMQSERKSSGYWDGSGSDYSNWSDSDGAEGSGGDDSGGRDSSGGSGVGDSSGGDSGCGEGSDSEDSREVNKLIITSMAMGFPANVDQINELVGKDSFGCPLFIFDTDGYLIPQDDLHNNHGRFVLPNPLPNTPDVQPLDVHIKNQREETEFFKVLKPLFPTTIGQGQIWAKIKEIQQILYGTIVDEKEVPGIGMIGDGKDGKDKEGYYFYDRVLERVSEAMEMLQRMNQQYDENEQKQVTRDAQALAEILSAAPIEKRFEVFKDFVKSKDRRAMEDEMGKSHD